ncbi:MAG: response regulator transcription factor [Chloroflexi bacterium]|nr:response regulator transcription factor [Chloroflexota bacterium]
MIRILLADDHTLFRQGLRQILEAEEGMEVVGEASDGTEAVQRAWQLEPDVILMDIQMPKMDGVEATRQIAGRSPKSRVIVLTMYRQDKYLFDAIKAGAQGYLLKDAESAEVTSAIRQVYQGEAIIDPGLAAKMIDEFKRLEKEARPQELQELSPQEMEILERVAEGKSNAEIANQLYLSEKTVRNRLTVIYEKLQVNNRTQAALLARQAGLGQPPEPKEEE